MDELTFTTLGALAWQTDSAAGVTMHAPVENALSYTRHAPCLVDAADLEQWANEYKPTSDSSVQRCPPIFLYRLAEPIVAAHGCTITRDGQMLLDTMSSIAPGGEHLHGFVQTDTPSWRQVRPIGKWERRSTLLLKRPWWKNYAHWLVDQAAALALLRDSDCVPPDCLIGIGAVTSPGLRRVIHDSLRSLAPDHEILELPDGEPVAFDTLYVTTQVHTLMSQIPRSVHTLRAALIPPPDAS